MRNKFKTLRNVLIRSSPTDVFFFSGTKFLGTTLLKEQLRWLFLLIIYIKLNSEFETGKYVSFLGIKIVRKVNRITPSYFLSCKVTTIGVFRTCRTSKIENFVKKVMFMKKLFSHKIPSYMFGRVLKHLTSLTTVSFTMRENCPVFELNTENTDQRKTSFLDNFHPVLLFSIKLIMRLNFANFNVF